MYSIDHKYNTLCDHYRSEDTIMNFFCDLQELKVKYSPRMLLIYILKANGQNDCVKQKCLESIPRFYLCKDK
jgi:hypothetical protein